MSFLKHFLYFLVLSMAITFTVWFFLGRPSIGLDDANIFLNYAKRFANGEGFTFNTGGERVEGFTSMLWVLICALFYKVSASPEPLILFFLLLVATLTITIVYREWAKGMQLMHKKIPGRTVLIIYSLFIIAVGPSYLTWSVLSLMENGIWNLLFCTAVVLTLRLYRNAFLTAAEKTGILLVIPLMVLARPEALVWVLLFLILLFIAAGRHRSGWLFPVLALCVFVVTVAVLTMFRLQYFGYPLPNTYYAKVSGDRMYNLVNGLQYMAGFLITYNPVITVLFSALVVAAGYSAVSSGALAKIMRSKEAGTGAATNVLIVTAVVLAGIAMVFITGGDHFGGFRFYQGLILVLAWGIPAMLWLWQAGTGTAARKYIIAGAVLFLLAAGANSLFDLKKTAQTQLGYEFYLASDGRTVAGLLNRCWPGAKPSVGVVAVGGFGLAYKGETVDLMGLNNTLMGHSSGSRRGIKNHAAFNKDVFYRLSPGILLPRPVEDKRAAGLLYAGLLNRNNFENQALKDIFNDARFIHSYCPYMITAAGGQVRMFGFVNKQALAKMETDTTILLTAISSIN